jgi:alkylation response protein AidB-like acyl-CoA dehydrogenase
MVTQPAARLTESDHLSHPGASWLATHAEAIAAARAFADSIAGSVVERDRSGAAPRTEMARFDACGLLGITVPRGDGGPGLEPTTLAEVIRIIAAVDPAIAQTTHTQDLQTRLATDQAGRIRLSGASAADARYDLDRHWRNARTHSIHDPADWKYHHEVNGVLPPNHAQL